MPEGDTIFRTARRLERVLGGQEVVAVDTTVRQLRALGVRRLVGQTVGDVETCGKHLLVWFVPSDLALHTHMRLQGSWHTYTPGQRWRKPQRLARVVLTTRETVAVCFNAPVVELLARTQVARHPALAGLGPDALDPAVDLDEAERRLLADPDRPAGLALLDQRVLAGTGNVYRCEVCFLEGVDPWARVGDLPAGVGRALLETARDLLVANVGSAAARRTTGDGAGTRGPRYHVYGRARRPCLRCGTPIRIARQGEQARITYWCPRCQGPGPPGRG